LAFIRHKKVHGHKYYQAVRNYRDKDGTHRQEVLCHLGVHSSLEAAIDAERKKAKIHQELALSQRTKAKLYGARRVGIHQTKLDKLLRVRQTYF